MFDLIRLLELHPPLMPRPRSAGPLTMVKLCAFLVIGAPAILGTWIGGLYSSPGLSVLFLGIGSGAVFQAAYQIGRNSCAEPKNAGGCR